LLKAHLNLIDTASDEQLLQIQTDLRKLLPTLAEKDVLRDTRNLLIAIDQERLERVMRQHRLGSGDRASA
jgi:hypothetical protein